MNHFFIGMLTFFVISSALVETAWSAPAEPSSIDYEFEEKVLEPVSAIDKPYVTEINVGKNTTYTIDIMPTAEQIIQALKLELPDEVKAKILAEGGELPPPIDPLKSYENLTPQENIRFRSRRLMLLRGIARILHYSSWGISAGILTKDTLSYTYRKAFRKEIVPQDKKLNERRHDFIQNLLSGLNSRLFFQAERVANANEVGLTAAIGGIALTGMRNKGTGGIAEIGFSIGFNFDQKAFVFEFSAAPEKFHHSDLAASVAGLNYKGGIYMSALRPDQATETLRGTSYYPPWVPGFSSDSLKYSAFGFSSGLGVPPPPIADFLTFSTTFERYKVVRVTIPWYIVGFWKIGVGDVGQLVRVSRDGVIDTYRMTAKRLETWRNRRACENIFAF